MAGIGVAVVGLAASWLLPPAYKSNTTPLSSSYGAAVVVPGTRGGVKRPLLPVTLAAVVGIATLAITRWPAAALLAAWAAGALPALMRSTSGALRIERIEAIAVWTELLRDTLAASAGLGQAIVATAELAPRVIRPSVIGLAERMTNGIPIEDALRAFAGELSDPSADIVVCALILASTAQAQRLTDLLGALAASAREEVAMRLRVEASRASSRSSVRTVVVFSLAFAAALMVVARSYLAPFSSFSGQIVLLVVGALYSSGLWLMIRMVRTRPGVRLLSPEPVR